MRLKTSPTHRNGAKIEFNFVIPLQMQGSKKYRLCPEFGDTEAGGAVSITAWLVRSPALEQIGELRSLDANLSEPTVAAALRRSLLLRRVADLVLSHASMLHTSPIGRKHAKQWATRMTLSPP